MPNLFIAKIDSDNVGTFRIDGDEVSYTIAPAFRGRGLATKLLREVRARFGRLQAEIYPHNVASIRAAERAGTQIYILSDPPGLERTVHNQGGCRVGRRSD